MKKLTFILCLFFQCQAFAQTVNVAGVMPTIYNSGSITKKWEVGFYAFAAFPIINLNHPNPSKDSYLNLLYLEPTLTYHLPKQFSVTAGYVYQLENVRADKTTKEDRFYLQGGYKHPIGSVTLKHRIRFDGRFIENRITHATPFTHRLRYLIGFDIPIKNKKNNLYFTAYEEGFFNTFKGAGAVYAENWAYAALGIKLDGDKSKLEVGPLYITWNTGPNSWFNQYYLQVTWTNHLDFTK